MHDVAIEARKLQEWDEDAIPEVFSISLCRCREVVAVAWALLKGHHLKGGDLKVRPALERCCEFLGGQ